MKNIFESSNYFNYMRETDEIIGLIETPIPGIVQLCSQLVKIPGYEYVEHIRCFKKIKEISYFEKDDYKLFITFFDKFKLNNHSLLEPIFNYN